MCTAASEGRRSLQFLGNSCRQSFDNELGQAFRLRLARGTVAKLCDGNAEAYCVLSRGHAVTPPQRVIGADIDGDGLGIDVVLLKRLLEIVQELARVAWTA